MKTSKNIFSSLLVVLFLISTISCTKIEEIKMGDVREVTFSGMNGNVITLKLLVPIDNPNSFNLRIKAADLKVLMGDKEIGKVKQIDDLLILSKSTQEYPVTVSIELTDVKEVMSSAIKMMSGGIHDLHLSGTVLVSSFLYSKKIKIEDYPLVK
jgi:LEA14-like dessication related protein